MKIVVTGPKCSGKSIIGSKLAEMLKLPFYESDELIMDLYYRETGSRLSCRALCSEVGDDEFRNYERRAVENITDREWCVISTGGSTMLNSNSRRILRNNSLLILLQPSISSLLKRLEEKKIPSFLNNTTAKDLFSERARLIIDLVKPYADISINSSELTEQETLARIIEQLQIEFSLRNSSPNTFGKLIRLTTFGESHGKCVGAVLDGVKPGIKISETEIQKELNRRKPGQSKVSTPRNEEDRVKILSGIFDGKTTGSPIAMMIENKNQDSSKYEKIKNIFRPGTADFTFWKKYSIRDYRGGGRASGRETASRVLGGAIAKQILLQYGIKVIAHTVSIGKVNAVKCDYRVIEQNDVRCADSTAAVKMEKAILEAKKENDSLGGIVKIDISGVPPGLGDPVFGKLDAQLGSAILSIGAVKGIEFGSGFQSTKIKGSENNDPMKDGRFLSNNAGGLLGGISNGEKIVIRAAVKPTPSIFKPQKTSNTSNENVFFKIEGRHDPCIIPRIIPVMESMSALTILDMIAIQKSINPDFLK
ncbi:MAG: chorismate synthase [Victivallales bacterium]|nr:chorismate synthase [Victivallales bacterium]